MTEKQFLSIMLSIAFYGSDTDGWFMATVGIVMIVFYVLTWLEFRQAEKLSDGKLKYRKRDYQ